MTFEELSYESGIGIDTVKAIVKKDLGFTKKCARWVPRLLTPEHKAAKVKMARDFLALNERAGFKDSIVTVDESWVSQFMPETKQQSSVWTKKGANPPRKAKRVESKKKLMYVLFFDSKGPIYQHFVPKVCISKFALTELTIFAPLAVSCARPLQVVEAAAATVAAPRSITPKQ